MAITILDNNDKRELETKITNNSSNIANLKEDFAKFVGFNVISENILNLNDSDAVHDAWNSEDGSLSSKGTNILTSGFIPYDISDTFCFSLPTDWYRSNVTLWDGEKQIIVSEHSFNNHKQVLSNSYSKYEVFKINKDIAYDKKWENAKYVRFTFWKDNGDFSDVMIVRGDTFPTKYIPYKNGFEYSNEFIKEVRQFSDNNVLFGKTILFTGDSVCAGYIDNGDGTYGKRYGWAEIIKENNPSITMKNYGQGGTTVAIQSGRTDSILERLDTMYAEYPNADYIIIEGGVNDCYSKTIQLGTITNGYNDVLDTSTFCGGLESLFKKATLKWKGKKIGYIALFKVPTANTFKEYMDKAKSICEKWSIPFIDLYYQSGLEYNIDEIKTLYSYGGGGLHPNVDGYKIITPKIESWIKTL